MTDDRVQYLRQRRIRRGGNPLSSVTKDATSNKYVPASAAEWTSTLSAAGISSGNPGWLWLLQEASGSLADSIGAATLTNLNSMAYQGAVTGWSRKAMFTGLDGADISLLNTADTNLPNLTTESTLVIAYAAIASAPAAERSLILSGNVSANLTTGLLPKLVNGANNATGAQSVGNTVHPWVIRHNRTASTTSLFTDLEKVSATFGSGGSTKRIFFGSGLQRAPVWSILYACAFKGAAAELSDAQLRTLLQKLGWTVSW